MQDERKKPMKWTTLAMLLCAAFAGMMAGVTMTFEGIYRVRDQISTEYNLYETFGLNYECTPSYSERMAQSGFPENSRYGWEDYAYEYKSSAITNQAFLGKDFWLALTDGGVMTIASRMPIGEYRKNGTTHVALIFLLGDKPVTLHMVKNFGKRFFVSYPSGPNWKNEKEIIRYIFSGNENPIILSDGKDFSITIPTYPR